MKLNLQWQEQKGQYASGENLYINRINVASVVWNIARRRDEPEGNEWTGFVNLPSLKQDRVYAKSKEEVKAKTENIVNKWFEEATATKIKEG